MKIIKMHDDARASMLVGINTAVNLAKVTLGGKGKSVMINIPGGIHNTTDGVTVLKNVAMTDDIEDMGVQLVLEVAERQVSECADGTTSVSILFQEIINRGMKAINNGADSLLIRNGIDNAVKLVVDYLQGLSKEVKRDSDKVYQIAKVSAHGDGEIAKIVSDAIRKTGEHSNITVEESRGIDTYVEINDGFKYNSGWLSHLFITNHKKISAELENPYILVYEGKVRDLKELVGILEQVQKENRSLLVVSDNLDGDALSSLAVNAKNGTLKVAAINPNGHSPEDTQFKFQDLAIATGCKILSPDHGDDLSKVTLDKLGQAKKIIVGQKSTLIVGGKFDQKEMDDRVSTLEAQLDKSENSFQEQILKGRLAALTGGVGIIHVGGTLGTESKERKDRVDDALGAALASVESGFVPGGGVSLLMAKKELGNWIVNPGWFWNYKGENLGMKIVFDALELPFKQIISNAGLNPKTILKELNNHPTGTGYNVIEGKYVDMVDAGILDPSKVEVNIVKNASLGATQFLNTDGVISPVINSKL